MGNITFNARNDFTRDQGTIIIPEDSELFNTIWVRYYSARNLELIGGITREEMAGMIEGLEIIGGTPLTTKLAAKWNQKK